MTTAPMANPDDALLAALTAAAEGLLVPSEQDAPLEPVYWPRTGRLTPAQLLVRLGLPPATPVEVRTLREFFGPLTRVRDPDDPAAVEHAARFTRLQRLLAARLADPVVYRVGTVEIAVLLIGLSQYGATLGLRTTLVET
jgi:Nuclease A inhibitor-like protein